LDVGCGTGKSTEPLVLNPKHRVLATGIDPDEAMLREARFSARKKGLSIEYISGFAEKLPFDKGSFDAVISGAAFHWFGNKKALSEIKGVLKQQGVIFIFWAQYMKSGNPTIGSDIYGRYNWMGIPTKFRGQPFVCDLLSRAGFKCVKTTTIPFIEKKTIAETIGCLKTNSSYAMMSPKTRKQFVREMTGAYKSALLGKKFDVTKLELRVVYGFK